MDPGSRRWSVPSPRTLAWLSVLLVVLCSLPWTVLPWYDATNDGSMYIVTARALVSGEGYSFLGIPFVIRPPGFSCLIAPILALRGTDFLALNLEVSLFGALGVLLFHFSLRERLGLLLATLVPLVLWFNPSYQRLCNQVMSDVPGWALLLACVLLARRLAARRTVASALWLGAAIALSSYVRAGNLLLAPAWIGALAARELGRGSDREGWRSVLRRSAALLAATLLVLAPWALRNRSVAPPVPADQTMIYSYSTAMWHADAGDPRSPYVTPAELLGRVPERCWQIVRTLGMRLGEEELTPWGHVLAGMLLAALVVAALRRRGVEELFALGTLLVVAFYFAFAARLLLPVFAFALVSLIELLRSGATRLVGARAGTAVAALLCLAWLACDWRPREGWDKIRSLHEAEVETARLVNENVAPNARLGAWCGWHHSVYLGRPVYSCDQACRRSGSMESCERVIDAYGLDTVMLTPLGLPELVRQNEREFARYIVGCYGGNERGIVRVR